jgi:hypothetical protein
MGYLYKGDAILKGNLLVKPKVSFKCFMIETLDLLINNEDISLDSENITYIVEDYYLALDWSKLS